MQHFLPRLVLERIGDDVWTCGGEFGKQQRPAPVRVADLAAERLVEDAREVDTGDNERGDAPRRSAERALRRAARRGAVEELVEEDRACVGRFDRVQAG